MKDFKQKVEVDGSNKHKYLVFTAWSEAGSFAFIERDITNKTDEQITDIIKKCKKILEDKLGD